MNSTFTRRQLLEGGLGVLALTAEARRPLTAAPWGVTPPVSGPTLGTDARAAVALMKGEDRRRNVYNALMAIEQDILPVLRQKKYVLIKPNNVSSVNQLAATHADALRGILDYLSERFHGPVMIGEAAAGETMEGFETFHYPKLVSEYKKQGLSLLDLNVEAKYQVLPVLDFDLHLTPVRLAARLMDPEAFVLCAAMPKTHNTVVATLSVKNMCLGAPLHQAPQESVRWNDKRKYHGGVRQTHYDILLTAQKLRPNWGATVIDGYEGMEGNGPASGTPVASRLAIASTDYIAADRIGLEVMGIKPEHVGYLLYCWQAGLGQYDLKKIDVIGETPASLMKPYRQHNDIERQLEWMGPMQDLPPKLG